MPLIVPNGNPLSLSRPSVGTSGQTFLVQQMNQEFWSALTQFFETTPLVKDFTYNVISTLRSVEYQDSLSDNVTGAGGGQSAHNYGLAVDISPVIPPGAGKIRVTSPAIVRGFEGQYEEQWAVLWNALSNHPKLKSGATFTVGRGSRRRPDKGHIEFRDWRTVAGPLGYNNYKNRPRRNNSTPSSLSAPSVTPRGPGISPYIAANDSLHPHIQYELTRRRVASETANSHFPLVKLTSLVKVYNKNLQGRTTDSAQTGPTTPNPNDFGAHSPSLGIHGISETTFDQIYYPVNQKSIVGYATSVSPNAETGKYDLIPVIVESADDDPPNIPPPGIISMNCERNTAGGFGVRGGLFRANLTIRAYSLGQVNVLLKYYIRQGTRVVLELGRTSSSQLENILTTSTDSEISRIRTEGLRLQSTSVSELFQKFDWKRSRTDIDNELEKLVKLETGQKEFIDKYTYNNFGNYEVFIGYVASFKMKYTKENVYDIELTVHSVQQFEVPTKLGGTRSLPNTSAAVANSCNSMDVMDYFNPKFMYRPNSFNRILADCTDEVNKPRLYETWGQHVIKLNSSEASPGTEAKHPGYLISWQCFVDLILNDPEYGLLGTFQLDQNVEPAALSLLRTGLISKIEGSLNNHQGNNKAIMANEVSWHKSLRSTDINTIIIYNKTAQDVVDETFVEEVLALLGRSGENEEAVAAIRRNLSLVGGNSEPRRIQNKINDATIVGSFDNTGNNTSYLTNGVWLNSEAIINSFSGADTISQGITELLNRMNTATQGFWNLQLLSAEPMRIGGLRVIDAGLSKPMDRPLLPAATASFDPTIPNEPTDVVLKLKSDVEAFMNTDDGSPKYLYVFNRKHRKVVGNADDYIGSELLDITVDSSMPNVIAVQAVAGVGGIAERGTLSAIDVDELKRISMYDTFVSFTPTQKVCDDLGIGSALAAKDPSGVISGIVGPVRAKVMEREIRRAVELPRGITPLRLVPTDLDRGANGQPIVARDGTRVGKTIQESNIDRTMLGFTDEIINAWKEQGENANKSEAQIEEKRKDIESTLQAIRSYPLEIYESNNPGVLGLIRQYSQTFGRAIALVENDTSRMIQLLDSDKNQTEVHPFNASNLTKTTVDLTLPGIGGILLFQAFTVDRIPNILRRGYYIVTKVVHEFSIDNGWVTKIQGRFRYKPEQFLNRDKQKL